MAQRIAELEALQKPAAPVATLTPGGMLLVQGESRPKHCCRTSQRRRQLRLRKERRMSPSQASPSVPTRPQDQAPKPPTQWAAPKPNWTTQPRPMEAKWLRELSSEKLDLFSRAK
jgi:hypothetical protein